MDLLQYLISPAAGAVIGYLTNWLAVKMLFRPHAAKHLGKLRLPFTPGLIPKEKERIAQALGDTVGNHLLTREALMEQMTSAQVLNGLSGALDQGIVFLKQSDMTLEDGLCSLLQEDADPFRKGLVSFLETKLSTLLQSPEVQQKAAAFIFQKLDEVLSRQISSLPLDTFGQYAKDFLALEGQDLLENGILRQALEKGIWNYLLKAREDERRLGELLSYESVQSLKDYFSLKTPAMADALLELTEKPEVEEKLKAKLAEAISTVTGAILGLLVDKNAIYEQLIAAFRTYIHNPASMSEIEEAVGLVVDKALDLTIGNVAAMATGELRELTVHKVVDTALAVLLDEENISGFVEKCIGYLKEQPDKTLWDLGLRAEPNLREKLRDWTDGLVQKAAEPLVLAFIGDGCKKYLSKILSAPICSLTEKLPEGALEKGKAFLLSRYGALMEKAAPKLLAVVDVNQIVAGQIRSFDMPYIESLILSIAAQELRAITLVGGVLGFLIGWIPVLMRIFGI